MKNNKKKIHLNPIYPFNTIKKNYNVKKHTDPFDFIKTLSIIDKYDNDRLNKIFGLDSVIEIIDTYDYNDALDKYLEYINTIELEDIFVEIDK